MALIRYPGSKAKLLDEILKCVPDEMKFELLASKVRWEYREPFFGAGAVGFEILNCLPSSSRIWLNDIDYGIYSLWRSVLNDPSGLSSMIERFTPSAEWFYEFKSSDGDTSVSELRAGFRKLALHQMSVSGFGAKSGGPLGGREQKNAEYPVDCRWNAETLQRHVKRLHEQMKWFKELQITNLDFGEVLEGVPSDAFVYLDPPYVEKGGQLYKHAMDEAAHRRLAETIQKLKCRWALSYDDHALVRECYSWAEFKELAVVYTNATNAPAKRPKNREVVITPV